MVAEQGSEKVLAREYELQFKGYDPAIVNAAATAVIGEAGRVFPPKVGELKAAVREEFTRRVGRPERAAWSTEDDGPYQAIAPEESARRAAQCAEWRKQYGFDKHEAPAKTEDAPWRPLSEAERENMRELMARKVA